MHTARLGGARWAASDLRVFRRLPGLDSALDTAALHGYLCFSYVPAPRTILAGASALPAGQRIVVTPELAACEVIAAWREQDPACLDEETAVEELRSRLRAAVARQLGREREVGVFLSGGRDSSLVAALLVEAGARVHLYTLDFGPPFDEKLHYARRVTEHLSSTVRPARGPISTSTSCASGSTTVATCGRATG